MFSDTTTILITDIIIYVKRRIYVDAPETIKYLLGNHSHFQISIPDSEALS